MNDDTLSHKISEGMRVAAEKGVHIGRPKAFVLSDDSNPSANEILIFARAGMSISETARAIGVNRMTLTRALIENGILNDYKRTAEQARGNPCTFSESGLQ